MRSKTHDTQEDRQKFLDAYIEAALWAEVDDDGEPFDNSYTREDLSPEALKRMTEDCTEFYNRTRADLILQGTEEQNGHDFWLSRNGHGTGFWDRGTESTGRRLHIVAQNFGGCGLYVGDDGWIYVE